MRVLLLTEALQPAILQRAQYFPIPQGWGDTSRNDTSQSVPQYTLLSDAKSFLFSVRVEGKAQCTRHPFGSFVEGLWEEDVAELFLLDEDGVSYQEFNISPCGAWWSQRFSDIRIPDEAHYQHPKGFVPLCQIRENSWEAGFFLSFHELSVKNRLRDGCKANVNVILGSGKARQYYSLAALPGDTPDFHQPQAFEVVQDGFAYST